MYFLPTTHSHLALLASSCYAPPAFTNRRMILSDRDIKKAVETGRVKIESDQPGLSTPQAVTSFMHIHASSMDLRLGNVFKLYEHSKFAILDPKRPETFSGNMRTITVADGESFIVQPGEFVLGV